MMVFWVVFLLTLSVVHIATVAFLTNKAVRAAKEYSETIHSKMIYDSEELGTLTVYSNDAILELHDGSVLVIPRMVLDPDQD